MEGHTVWRRIWGKSKEYQKDTEWFKDVKKELKQDEGQFKIDIAKYSIMRVFKKFLNWRATGPDNFKGTFFVLAVFNFLISVKIGNKSLI